MKEDRKTFDFKDNKLGLMVTYYSYRDRLAVLCIKDGELYSDITINLPDKLTELPNYAFIDGFAKDSGLEKTLIKIGVIKEVIEKDVQYNMGKYDKVAFDFDVLREYDPIGLEEYLDVKLPFMKGI